MTLKNQKLNCIMRSIEMILWWYIYTKDGFNSECVYMGQITKKSFLKDDYKA